MRIEAISHLLTGVSCRTHAEPYSPNDLLKSFLHQVGLLCTTLALHIFCEIIANRINNANCSTSQETANYQINQNRNATTVKRYSRCNVAARVR